MSEEVPPTLTAQAPDAIEAAYWTFKGSKEVIGMLDAKELLEVTHTARITSTTDHRWCVAVYLDVEDDDIPEVIEQAAAEHDLVEVERDHNYDGTLESVTYARSQ